MGLGEHNGLIKEEYKQYKLELGTDYSSICECIIDKHAI